VTPFQQDQVEILRRIAERGRRRAQVQWLDVGYGAFSEQVDLWQHLLDEIKRLKESA
jgi:hypothetical protein